MIPPVTLCFAVDPGPTRSGCALVRLEPTGWPSILWGGHVDSNGTEIRTQLRSAATQGAIIAIEHLQGYAYQAKRVAALIETGQAEGLIKGLAELELREAFIDDKLAGRSVSASRLGPRQLTASDWRGALCRSATASDAQIRLVVEGLCKVRPAPKADARPHIWDAAGLAIVALARENGRAITLPPALSGALHQLQVEEKGERADRKARGTVEALQKRFPTRKQTENRAAAAKRGWQTRNGGA